MVSEVKRHGLSLLYQPSEGDPDVDVVFVHGLFGYPESTWSSAVPNIETPAKKSFVSAFTRRRDRSNNRDAFESQTLSATTSGSGRVSPSVAQSKTVLWPRDLLPGAMPRLRVFTYGYDVDIFSAFSMAGKASVYQHATTLLGDLCDQRISKESSVRPIIFVAHSLGGIVVKDALSQSRSERTHFASILPATIGVCFIGTPHRGSSVASLGKIAAECSKAFFRNPNIQVLTTLETNSTELDRIGVSFNQILVDRVVQIHSFYEEYPTNGVMVVQNFSYSIGEGFEITSGIPANHSDMTKVSKSTDTGFGRVVGVLQRWVNKSKGTKINILPPFIFQKIDHNAMITYDVRVNADKRAEPSINEAVICLNSLNFVQTRYRAAEVEKTFGNTYQWVFRDEVGFKKWLGSRDNSRSTFWIQGKPGSGKSTLMKFVLHHEYTLRYLRESDPSQWIMAGFFFHDRGLKIQKSIEGLLCSILYTILLHKRDLVRFVLPVFRNTAARKTSLNTHAQELAWSATDLFTALRAVMHQTEVKANIFMLVDALDEHDGDHRVLLDMLDKIASSDEMSPVRVKLCLASRQENIFETSLTRFPKFAIHEYTFDDITTCIRGRLEEESCRCERLLEAATVEMLVTDMSPKARGVFIWVKLVLDEMMDQLENGDSVAEIRTNLSTTPSELGALYERILSKLVKRLRVKDRRETYVMFQIALCARNIFPLPVFVLAARLLSSNTPIDIPYTRDVLSSVATTEMKLRLNSRCGGLLEVVTGYVAGEQNAVQFLHQTTKEFVEDQLGSSLFLQLGSANENGHLLLVRYSLLLIKNDLPFKLPNFVYHACRAEQVSQASVARELNLLSASNGHFSMNLVQELCNHLDFDKSFGRLRMTAVNPVIHILLIAIFGNLVATFKHILTPDLISASSHGGCLLSAAVLAASTNKNNGMFDKEIALHLLERGVPADSKHEGKTPLQVLAEEVSGWHDLRFDQRQVICAIVKLLLEHGADPNQPIISKPFLPIESVYPLSRSMTDQSRTKDGPREVDRRLLDLVFWLEPPHDFELADLLLKHRASVRDGSEVLRKCVAMDKKPVARLLLVHGVNPIDPRTGVFDPRLAKGEIEAWRMFFQEYHNPQVNWPFGPLSTGLRLLARNLGLSDRRPAYDRES